MNRFVLVAPVLRILECLFRPVLVSLRITVEADALGSAITGARVDQQERVGAVAVEHEHG